MDRTHKEHILDFLWSVAPNYVTNSQIREATGIESYQQVYLLTQELTHVGLIQSERRGREWVFRADESPTIQLTSPGRVAPAEMRTEIRDRLSPRAFEELARSVMSAHLLPLSALTAVLSSLQCFSDSEPSARKSLALFVPVTC